MQHGNKKYNFEDLKKRGDIISVKPANIYSLKNSLRLYAKENNIDYAKAFAFEDGINGMVEIKRIS